MSEYIWQEIVYYFKSRGFSKKKAKQIADHWTQSVEEAMQQQLDIELSYMFDNISREED